MDARSPKIQENGREMAIAPEPILPTCEDNNYTLLTLKAQKSHMRMFNTYQKLLEKAKISEHADNDKNWDILPQPVMILVQFHYCQS